MLLDLTQIRNPVTDLARQYQAPQFAGRSDEFRVVAPVDLQLKIHKDHARFRLAGSVATVLELTCSRCLEPYVLPVTAVFDLRYLPQSENVGVEREIKGDEFSESFYQDDEIDLGQLMEEQFYLALPMKPLCGPDCKGLCINCGANLNVAACDCQVRWEDPRLAGLRALIDRNKDNA
jgi:uncharacterized protein